MSSRAVFSRSILLSEMGRRRHYSEETPKVEKEEGKGANPEAEDLVSTPNKEKLNAKEAEVIDLTVRVTRGERIKSLTDL